ncbi:hypothetical protein LS48_04110 [Aequorivita aquimaris]|uniref:Uncharacterized protein n=1 Tax=Aequorivita aquimaris TaxID=1548749 RepID=A0A137RK83_9FLAO|nr:hypothetical protein LS48_04110 [Aequorivita aquimaris]
MTFRISILLFLLLSYFNCLSQKEVLSVKIDDNTSMLPRKKKGFNFLNTTNGDLVIVMIDNKMGFANLFDNDFNEKGAITFDPSKHENILGYKIIGNTYEILFSNNSKKKFLVLSINFDSKKVSEKEFKFDFDDEKYLETVHYNNQLFLFTSTKENVFIIRELGENGFETLKSFQIENRIESFFDNVLVSLDPTNSDGFYDENRKQKLLKREQLFGSLKSNVTKIDNRVPNVIEQTAQNNKLYQKDNLIYLTIEDDENLQTIFYKIDLDVLSMEQAIYEYPKGRIWDFKKYNSFILDDKIFQLGINKDEMKIYVKNFEGEILKEFYIEKNQPIKFKNSPIIQDGETFLPFVNHRELEETSQYLRKVSSGNIGITGYRDNNLYHLTIGGYIELNGGGMGMMGGSYNTTISASGGVPSVSTTYINPTFYSYSTYSSTKSTFFNTHLDADFNYVSKETSENIFDRIKEFKKGLQYESAEDVFIHDDKVYFSYYNLKEKLLKIIEM